MTAPNRTIRLQSQRDRLAAERLGIGEYSMFRGHDGHRTRRWFVSEAEHAQIAAHLEADDRERVAARKSKAAWHNLQHTAKLKALRDRQRASYGNPDRIARRIAEYAAQLVREGTPATEAERVAREAYLPAPSVRAAGRSLEPGLSRAERVALIAELSSSRPGVQG